MSDICDQRQDEWGGEVALRLAYVRCDLPANDGMYHVLCYNLFRKIPMDTSQSTSCRPSIDESLQNVVDIMRADMCLSLTVAELYSIYVETLGHLSRKQMLVNLCDYFGDEVVVLSAVEGCDTIVGFRTFVAKSLKMVKVSGSDENDDVAKVVRRVKAEVRKIPQPREYDLSDFTFSKTVDDTSETLLRLVSALVSDGNVTKPSLTISQTIQQHISGARKPDNHRS